MTPRVILILCSKIRFGSGSCKCWPKISESGIRWKIQIQSLPSSGDLKCQYMFLFFSRIWKWIGQLHAELRSQSLTQTVSKQKKHIYGILAFRIVVHFPSTVSTPALGAFSVAVTASHTILICHVLPKHRAKWNRVHLFFLSILPQLRTCQILQSLLCESFKNCMLDVEVHSFIQILLLGFFFLGICEIYSELMNVDLHSMLPESLTSQSEIWLLSD